MIGVSEQSLPRALELAGMAEQAGGDLILSTPPYSYSIPQSLIYEYFKELAARSGMPLVVYQNDEVGVRVEVETLVRLSTTPGIIGVKGYMPFNQLQRCFRKADQPGRFAVMSGDEYLYAAALLLGIRHFTMGGPGNVCPMWCTSIYRSALDNDWTAVSKKQRRLTDFCDALYTGMDTAYAAIKYALKCLGVCSAHISSPHRAISPEQQKQVERVLTEYAEVVAS
jgi:4-hydroxy-tetrahydrodipicolinate synthase